MKMIVLSMTVLLIAGLRTSGQGIIGFFHQQADKKKLMLAQIASLAVYRNQQQAGYRIGEQGLAAAYQQEQAEFAAHEQYQESLKQVNPAIAPAAKLRELEDYRQRTLAALTSELSWQLQHKGLQPNEVAYLRKVKDGMLYKLDVQLGEAREVTTPGKLQMTDAERLDRLDQILAGVKDEYAFSGSFTSRCRKLSNSRFRHREDRDQLKKLYGN